MDPEPTLIEGLTYEECPHCTDGFQVHNDELVVCPTCNCAMYVLHDHEEAADA